MKKKMENQIEFSIAFVEETDLKSLEDEVLSKLDTRFQIANVSPNTALKKAFEIKGFKIVGRMLYRSC